MRKEPLRLTLCTDARHLDLLLGHTSFDERFAVRRPQVESVPVLRLSKQVRSVGERLDDVLTHGVAARSDRRADARDDVPWLAAKAVPQRLDRRARGPYRAAPPARVDCRHNVPLWIGQ